MNFMVGDRVRYLGGHYNTTYDDVGTIIGERNGGFLVEFDRNVRGHAGGIECAIGMMGHCWYISPGEMEKDGEATPFDISLHSYISKELGK